MKNKQTTPPIKISNDNGTYTQHRISPKQQNYQNIIQRRISKLNIIDVEDIEAEGLSEDENQIREQIGTNR